MDDFINLSEQFPEETDIVCFEDYNNIRYFGFYILPYRAYPNSYFDPYKFAQWCIIEQNGNWHPTDIKPLRWKRLCSVYSELGHDMMRGHYVGKKRWFPKGE